MRFKELLRITPDFSLFARHYGEPSHTFYLVGEPKIESDGCFFIRFFNTDKDTVRRVFPEFGDDYEVIDPHNRPGFRSRKRVENKPDFGVEIRGAMAGTYFVRPHPSGIVLPLSVLFAAQFIISNVVRYKPAFWMSVLDGTNTGAASLVEALCNLMERRFPCDVLESLWNERFTFGAPGYMT